MSVDTPHVLVVDDETNIQILVRRNLLRYMARVHVMDVDIVFANNPPEALELMETTRVDLVITDVDMQHRHNGFWLKQAITERFSSVPVLVMSGSMRPGVDFSKLRLGELYTTAGTMLRIASLRLAN